MSTAANILSESDHSTHKERLVTGSEGSAEADSGQSAAVKVASEPNDALPAFVELTDVSKMYRLGRSRFDFKDETGDGDDGEPVDEEDGDDGDGSALVGDRRELWALQDFSLRLSAGDRVGVLGKNGAGKSTLLKVLGGLTLPTDGSIRGRGQMINLSSMRAPLDPEASGRKNLIMMATILGISRRRIDELLPAVIEFSGLGDLADTRVARYSRGMYPRLAFSLALEIDPEILLVDDTLTVGDAEFAGKFMTRIADFAGPDKIFVLSTHRTGIVERLCNRAILLDGGKLVLDGSPESVITRYLLKDDDRFPGDESQQLDRIGFDDRGLSSPGELAPFNIAGPEASLARLGWKDSEQDVATQVLAPFNRPGFGRPQVHHAHSAAIGADNDLAQQAAHDQPADGVSPIPSPGQGGAQRAIVRSWAEAIRINQEQRLKSLKRRQAIVGRSKKTHESQVLDIEADDLAIIRSFRLQDEFGNDTRTFLPGCDIFMEFAIETKQPGVRIEATVQLVSQSQRTKDDTEPSDGPDKTDIADRSEVGETGEEQPDAVPVYVTNLPIEITAGEARTYFLAHKIDGHLTGQILDRAIFKVAFRLVFRPRYPVFYPRQLDAMSLEQRYVLMRHFQTRDVPLDGGGVVTDERVRQQILDLYAEAEAAYSSEQEQDQPQPEQIGTTDVSGAQRHPLLPKLPKSIRKLRLFFVVRGDWNSAAPVRTYARLPEGRSPHLRPEMAWSLEASFFPEERTQGSEGEDEGQDAVATTADETAATAEVQG